MTKKNSGKKTMLLSVILSSPGVIVVGIGLLIGKSSTQTADFIRRSIELLAIIISFVIYCITTSGETTDEEKRRSLERTANIFVSVSMMICGVIMLCLAIFSESDESGNVIPGLVIAILGVITNGFFSFRYSRLGKNDNNAILLTQSKLYLTKTFVDLSVTVALSAVLISHSPEISYAFDLGGTVCVSLYLVFSGIKTLILAIKNN